MTQQAIAALPNLGPKSAAMLHAAGIRNLTQLRKLGAIGAYVQVKQQHAGASLNLLYALVAALEAGDWKQVQRERKLELMLAVEDYQRAQPETSAKSGKPVDELLQLRNIGKAMRADFELLGIQSVKQLAGCDADELYARIQSLTHTRHDPCVWDTYAAAIHQASTGEALPWWAFTKIRKQRQAVALPAAGTGLKKNRSCTSTMANPAVAAKFDTYPADIRTRLLSLRELILQVAATTEGVGALEETLKWGQISYLTSQTGSGSLIRLDQHGDSPTGYALYFHCQTTLVDSFRELFGQQFRYEGNRCLVFDVRKAFPAKALRQCIGMALTYHLTRKAAQSDARRPTRRTNR